MKRSDLVNKRTNWTKAKDGVKIGSLVLTLIDFFSKKKTEKDLYDASSTEPVYLEIDCRRCRMNNQINWDRKEELKCIKCHGPLYVDDRTN